MDLSNLFKITILGDPDVTGAPVRAADLCTEWTDARVPGEWITDYVRAGKLADPYIGKAYTDLFAYENHHIFYSAAFTCDAVFGDEFFRFEGIDTVADVFLNGSRIGHAENMYIPHEFAARGLRTGENELFVHIYPVGIEARRYPNPAFVTALKYNFEGLPMRKAMHMFGWDICPRIVSGGLWRKVSLIRKTAPRTDSFYLFLSETKGDESSLGMAFTCDVGRDLIHRYELSVEGVCGEHRFCQKQKLWHTSGYMKLSVTGLRLWHVRGYGDANLYDITVTLFKDGVPVHTMQKRQGFRTVSLVHDDYVDENGNGDFRFFVNGHPVYIKGTNWVPADALHGNDGERTPKILELVKDSGCNALRVWGGGVYESDEFYRLCDENGIFVWQDFMMACAVYPHDERMKAQLTEEVTAAVKRLRDYACICLWAGDNECDNFYMWSGMPIDPNENILTRELIPAVLRAEDLARPYLPCSPYISEKAYATGHAYETPEQHLWGPRDYFKGHYYHDANAVFASEMGYHGCNSPVSLRTFLGEDKVWPVDGNPMYLYHAASPETEPDGPYVYRIGLMSRQVETLFADKPTDINEYARMSQISQAEAKKFFVESFRARRNRRTGLIWWNMTDCWPQISDAVVDYYFVRKLAYFYIRRSQLPVCLMADDHTGALLLYGVNDRLTGETVSFTVRDIETDEVIAEGAGDLAPEASTVLGPLGDHEKTRFLVIDWTDADGMHRNHYLTGSPKISLDWYLSCLDKAGLNDFEGFEEE